MKGTSKRAISDRELLDLAKRIDPDLLRRVARLKGLQMEAIELAAIAFTPSELDEEG